MDLKKDINIIRKAFTFSLPALFGYFPLGMVFGFLFEQEGFPWYLAPVFSAFIYSGSAQFLALTLMSAGKSVLIIIATTTPLMIRNVFFGLSFIERFSNMRLLKPFLAFGLVDVTYSILLSHKEKNEYDDKVFSFFLTLFIYSYWILSSLLGAIGARYVPNDIKGLEFSLTALFIVLSIEQYTRSPKNSLYAASIISAIIVALLLPQFFLIGSLVLSFLFIQLYEHIEVGNGTK